MDEGAPIGFEFDVERRQSPAKGTITLAVIAAIVSIVAFMLLASADAGSPSPHPIDSDRPAAERAQP